MEELLLERQLNSKTFKNDDGTRTLHYYGNNIHFNKNGNLEEIDVKFYLNTTSSPAYYLYNTINNTFRIGLAENLSVDKAIKFSFRYDGLGDVYTSLKGMALYDSEKDEYTIFQTPQPNKSTIIENVVNYGNVYSGVNVEFHSLQDKLKEFVYLNDKSNIPNPTDYGYNPDTTYVIFLSLLETNLLELQVNNENELEVYNEGVKKLTSPKEWAKDNDNQDLDIINKYNIENGEYYFGVKYNKLISSSLPVVIDPTWQSSTSVSASNFDKTVYKEYDDYDHSTGYYFDTPLTLGDNVLNTYVDDDYKSMIRFDLSNVFSNSRYLQSANFNLYSATNLYVTKITSSWNNNTPAFSLWQINNIQITEIQNDYYSGSPLSLNVKSVIGDWLDNPNLNFGFYLQSSTYQIIPSLENSDITKRPYLSLVYTSVVTGFVGTPQTSTSIKWGWNTLTDASKYRIYDNNNVLLQEIIGNVNTSWTETNLNPNTSYTRNIKYVDSNGVEQTAVATASATTYATLQPANNLYGGNISSNSIVWSWVDGNNLLPKFDSGLWKKSASGGVTFDSANKATIISSDSLAHFAYYDFTNLKLNTNYTVSFVKSTSFGSVAVDSVDNVNYTTTTLIGSGNTSGTLTFNTGNNTTIEVMIQATGTGTVTFENLSLVESSTANQNVTSYEILDKNGVLLYTTPDGNTKTYTENNLRYNSNYIRQVRVVRNGERSSNVSMNITTTNRPTSMATQTITTTPNVDTYTDTYNSSINYGANTNLLVGRGASSSYVYNAYIKFPILLSTDSTINNVTLVLYSSIASGYNEPWIINKITNQWNENTLTNSLIPTVDNTNYYTNSNTMITNGDNNFPLNINLIQNWLANPSTNYGIKISRSTLVNNDYASFYSREYSDTTKIPRLTINYTPPLPPLPPTNLTGTTTSPSTVHWSWTAGDNTATEYRLYNADNDQLIGKSTTTTYDESGITLGNTYNRYVTAYNNGGESPIASASLMTSSIGSFVGTPLTSTSIKWTWNLLDIVDKINIYDNNNVLKTQILNGQANEWTETGLSVNTPYTRIAKSLKNNVESVNYAQNSATTYVTLVGIQGNSPTNILSNSITWNWTDSNNVGVSYYEILDKYGSFLYKTNNGTTFTFTENNLRYNTDYARKIRANRNGELSATIDLSAKTSVRPTTGNLPPLPPINLIGTTISTTVIRWSWTAGDNTATTGYKIYNANNDQLIGTTTSNTYYDQSGINIGDTLNIYVTAYNDFGESSATKLTLTTTYVSNFVGNPQTSTKIKWTWNSVANADKYVIYDANDFVIAEILKGNPLEYTESKLNPNTPYGRKIKHVIGGIEQNEVVTTSGRTYTTLVNISSANASNITPNSITWHWTDDTNQGVTGYKIIDEKGREIHNSSPNGYEKTWVENNKWYETTYTRKIYVLRQDEISSYYSITATTSSRTTQPITPTNLTIETQSINTVRWKWIAGDNIATEYRIYETDTDRLIGSSTTTYYDESNVQIGTTYKRYVTAYNTDGESPPISVSLVVSPIAKFVGSPLMSSAIKWTWTSFGTVDKVEIYDTNNTKKGEITGSSLEWIENGLDPQSNYTRELRYVVGGQEKKSYLTNSATTYQTLNPIPSATASNITSNSITWNWGIPTGNDGTIFYEILDKNGVIYTSPNNVTQSWSELLLRYGSTYERSIRVRRVNEVSDAINISATTTDRLSTSISKTTTLNPIENTYVFTGTISTPIYNTITLSAKNIIISNLTSTAIRVDLKNKTKNLTLTYDASVDLNSYVIGGVTKYFSTEGGFVNSTGFRFNFTNDPSWAIGDIIDWVAYFNGTTPTSPSTDNNIFVGKSPSGTSRGLVKFPIDSLPKEINITNTVLSLYNSNINTAYTYKVYKTTDKWFEASPLTWNTEPLYDLSVIGSLTGIISNGYNSFTLNKDITIGWYNDLSTNNGYTLLGDETVTNSQVVFNSNKNISNKPKLDVTYDKYAPLPPNNLTYSLTSETSVKWSWEAGGTGTTVSEYRLYDGQTDRFIGSSTTLSFDELNIALGEQYDRYVTAYNECGESPLASISVVLSPIENFKGISLTSTSIKWSWDLGNYPIDNLIIYDDKDAILLNNISTNTFEWIESKNILPSTSYTRKIRYVKDGKLSTVYSTFTIKTYDTLISPQSANGIGTKSNAIKWAWSDSVNQDITGFEILDKYNQILMTISDPSITTWTESLLRYSTDYERHIRAVRFDEKSDYIIANGRTLDRPANVDELPVTETLPSIADAYIDYSNQNNYGNSTTMYLGKSALASNNETKAIIKFDTSGIATNRVFKTAKMRLYESGFSGTPPIVDIELVNSSWAENTINSKNVPSNTKISSMTFTTTTGQYYEVNLPIDNLQSWISDKSTNNGLLLEQTSKTIVGYVIIQARENTYKPELVVSHEVAVAPLAPTNLIAHIKNDTAITWSWNETTSLNAQGYNLYDATNDRLIATLPLGTTSFVENNLTFGSTLNRYVVAYNNYGESAIVLKTFYFGVVAPTNLMATTMRSDEIKWEFDDGGYLEYRIYNYANSVSTEIAKIKLENGSYNVYLDSNPSQIASSSNVKPTFLQDGLQPNTTYSIKVSSVLNTRESILSNVVTATTFTALVSPQNLTANVVDYNTIVWSWTDTVNQSTTGFEILDKHNNIIKTLPNTTTSWTEEPLRYGTTYDRYVRAIRIYEKGQLGHLSGTTQARPTGTPLTLNPNADTFIASGNSTANFGVSGKSFYQYLYIGKPDSTNYYNGLVKFDLSTIPSNNIITDAKIRFYLYTTSNQILPEIDIYKTTSTWSESSVTWDTRPTYDNSKVIGKINNLTSTLNQYYETKLDVTSLQSLVGNASNNFGFTLQQDNPNNIGYIEFNSREASANKPELVITYNVPVAPKPVATINGTIASDHSIVWSWSASDSTNVITGYRIYNYDTDELIKDIPNGNTVTSFEETGINVGKTCKRYVVSYNQYGESSASPTATVTLEVQSPTNIVGIVQSSSRILWTFSDNGYNEYHIYQYNPIIPSSTLIARIKHEGANYYTYLETNLTTPISSNSSPQFLQHGLLANTTYYIKVSAVGIFEGYLSNSVNAKTNSLPNLGTISGFKNDLNNFKWTIS